MKVLTNADVLKHFAERDSVFDTPEYVQGDEDGLFYLIPRRNALLSSTRRSWRGYHFLHAM